MIWGFTEVSGTILGVPIVRTIVYWGLYRGPLILGNYHIDDYSGPYIIIISTHVLLGLRVSGFGVPGLGFRATAMKNQMDRTTENGTEVGVRYALYD